MTRESDGSREVAALELIVDALDDIADVLRKGLANLAAAAQGRPPRANHKVVLELNDEAVRLLEALSGGELAIAKEGDVQGVIEHIVHGFVDGVRRPGSWERGCVVQFFGDSFEQRLEQGDAPWERRPRARAPEVEPAADDPAAKVIACSHCGAVAPEFHCTVNLSKEEGGEQACDNPICAVCVRTFGETCRRCMTDPEAPLLHRRVRKPGGGK